jgi:hypothetical protein
MTVKQLRPVAVEYQIIKPARRNPKPEDGVPRLNPDLAAIQSLFPVVGSLMPTPDSLPQMCCRSHQHHATADQAETLQDQQK